jgi:TonB family protein
MGDSIKYRPRRGYARPGEIDISLLEANSPKPRPNAELEPSQKNLAPPGIVESRPAPLRPAVELNPNRKSLAPAPRILEAKPAAMHVGVEAIPNRTPPPPLRGLAPPPGIIETRPVPLRPTGIDAPIFKRKAPPPRPQWELTPGSKNPSSPRTTALLISQSAFNRKTVSARFELLPDGKPRWNQIGWSAAGQLVFLGLPLLSPMIFPQTMQTALKFDVVELMQPVSEIPVPPATPHPPAPPPRPKIKPKIEPKAPELKPEVPQVIPELAPRLNPKQPHVFMNLKPVLPKVRTVEVKPLELKPNLKQTEIVLSSSGPKAPKEEPKPNPGGGNPAPGTVNAAASKVQTGGFGDPNGLPGHGDPNRRGNINQAGSPGLPGGPGYGNGTSGAQGLRGTIASDGSGKGAGGGGVAAGAMTSGVTILYKPNPSYSPEGLDHKMQGDVVLDVVFLASGRMQVTRVVSGLGFGLDEQAIEAAKRIRFTPAKRDGQPTDFPARVRIEFRLIE